MKRFGLMMLFALVPFTAMAGRQPIYEGQVTYEKSIDAEKLTSAIKKGLLTRGWKPSETTGNEMTARLNLRSHQADIKLTWADGKVVITYVDSQNLDYKEKGTEKLIHKNYNSWIKNLEKDIAIQLSE